MMTRGYDLRSCRGFGCECVTFGAPRLGDAVFAQLFREEGIKLARMVNRWEQRLGKGRFSGVVKMFQVGGEG
jgi:hypothetical protein